jgi:hypothetical protein
MVFLFAVTLIAEPRRVSRRRGINRHAMPRGYSIPPLGFGRRATHPEIYDDDESEDEIGYPLLYRPHSMPGYVIQQPTPPILIGYQPPMALLPQAQTSPRMQGDLQEIVRLTSNISDRGRVEHSTTRRLIDILVPRAPHEIDALRNAFEISTRTDLSVTLSDMYRQKSFSVQCILVGLSMSPICFDIWLLLRVTRLLFIADDRFWRGAN